MNITVTMASGDVDEWENVADAIDAPQGSLLVLGQLEDEVPDNIKTIELSKDTGTKFETFQVHAQYAPGMWIKVEYS